MNAQELRTMQLNTFKGLISDCVGKPLELPEAMVYVEQLLDKDVQWDSVNLDELFFQFLETRQQTKFQ